ncbi:MAG TPA: GIY-YIG nuclease family protein, partial [Bdellovibrionales bacterium]|nr:GIY-YIG nuclease family protein [Bdellovibrionales bacterium]
MSSRVFFLDCQTTGPNPEKGALLELAWGFDETSIMSYLVQVPDGVPNRIQQLTGVTEEDMRKALSPGDVLDRFIDSLQSHGIAATEPAEDVFAVIHYAKFEERFLKEFFARFGRELPFQILCTHELARRVVPQLPSRGLRGLAGFFGHRKAEEKRAADHVEATIAVWRGLCEKMGCTDPLEARRWLGEAVPKRAAFVYPLDKNKRLGLPDAPGVYRFVNRKGEILYVGKATSLKDRVNSYFRGRKGRDHRKLEMLTQAWDLDVTVCKNIMEASMLESDLIKEHTPPYNLALKSANKTLVYYSRDFLSVRMIQDREHPMGPFPAFSAIEQLWMFCQGVADG